MLNGPSLRVAGLAGLGIALPSVDYLAALAVILASGAAASTQVAALVGFNVVAFALVEIPLLGYVLAPQATLRWVESLHDWIRSRRRVDVASCWPRSAACSSRLEWLDSEWSCIHGERQSVRRTRYV